jgi:hypothetical protein
LFYLFIYSLITPKDTKDGQLTEGQKKSVELVIKRIVDGLSEIDKILEKTNANLEISQKIRDVEESIVNKKIQLNEQGKVKVAEHLNNNKYKYAGGAAACGAVAAGGGATFVVLSEGVLGATGTCCVGTLTVPSVAAIGIPFIFGGALMFGLVIGLIKLTQLFVDISVKNDKTKLENLESKATKLKSCMNRISEVAIRLNQSNETTKLDVKNLQSCIIDCFQLKMFSNSSKINEAIKDCESIKAKLDEISQISL